MTDHNEILDAIAPCPDDCAVAHLHLRRSHVEAVRAAHAVSAHARLVPVIEDPRIWVDCLYALLESAKASAVSDQPLNEDNVEKIEVLAGIRKCSVEVIMAGIQEGARQWLRIVQEAITVSGNDNDGGLPDRAAREAITDAVLIADLYSIAGAGPT